MAVGILSVSYFCLFLAAVTLDELISIAEQVRPHMERLMKIKVAPWIRDYVVNMEDLYTEVFMEKLDNKPTGLHICVLNHYKDLFVRPTHKPCHPLSLDKLSAVKRLRLNNCKIVLKGDPGMGKTTLCKKIAWDWARGLFTEYHIVFFVYLKFVKPQDFIENIILQQNPFIAGLKVREKTVETILSKYSNRCLLILDGLDEHALGSNEDVLKIIRGEKCLDCNIIVTSRPHSTKLIESYFQVIARVEGFTKNKAEQFASKILKDREKITAVLNFKPANLRQDIPIYKCPILLSFMCLLVREEDIDLTNTTMHVREIYTRMVLSLYNKYLIRKGRSFHTDQFKTAIASIAKLALKTLLSGNPLLQRSYVIQEVGPDVFDYGLLICHEDAHILLQHVTADILVTFPHRSLQEFLGCFFFLWMIDKGKEIQSLLGENCLKPIFLENPLFLQFCLWFMCDNQNYFLFSDRNNVYWCLIKFSLNVINCPVLDMIAYPALDISYADITKDKMHTNFLTDIVAKCNKSSKLIYRWDSILELFDPILKAITCIEYINTTFEITFIKANEMTIKAKNCTWNELNRIMKYYTKVTNEPTVHLQLNEYNENSTKTFSYPNVKSVRITNPRTLEIPIEIIPHLTHLYIEKANNVQRSNS